MDQERLKELKKACKGKRAAFVEHLMECENGTEAVILAGATDNRKSAATMASRWLLEPAVRAYRDALQEAVAEEINVCKNSLLAKTEKIYRRCMQISEVYDKEGNPLGEFIFDAKGASKAVELQAKLCGELTEKREIEGNGFTVNISTITEGELNGA